MKRIICAAILLLAAFTFSMAQVSSIPAAAGGGGSGTVTDVNGSNGVATTTGSAFTGSGTLWANWTRNAQTGTSYAIVTGDRGKVVTFSNAGSIAVTIAQAGTTGFETGWLTVAKNIGAGTVTITPTTSTVDGAATITLLTGDWALISSDGTNYETVNNKAISGAGVTVTTSRTGKQIAADTAVMLSRRTDQSGVDRYCASSNTAGTTYTCSLSPTLNVLDFVAGSTFIWSRTNGCTSGTSLTLNIDSLGATSVFSADGSTVLTTTECAAGRPLHLEYNGTHFRVIGGGGGAGTITGGISWWPFGVGIDTGASSPIVSANRVLYLAVTAISNAAPSTIRLYGYSTSNVGNQAVAFYDKTCTTRLFASNAVAGTGSGVPQVFTFASPTTLVAGEKYYLAITSDNASTAWHGSGGGGYVSSLADASVSAGTEDYFYDSSTSSHSAGVTTWPSACSGTRVSNGAYAAPGVYIR